MDKRAIAYLSEKNKKYWHIFPLHIGSYSLQNKKKVEKERNSKGVVYFYTRETKYHDPQKWFMKT
jgi:hypothetical protein